MHSFVMPGKPAKTDGICFYIYFNIFFSGKGDGQMNQFVPQLMLGNSLTNSSGPPDYKPIWVHHDEWTFSSQCETERLNDQATDRQTNRLSLQPHFTLDS